MRSSVVTMIIGIGIDIVNVDRIKSSIERFGHHFLRRVYTSEEQRYCNGKSSSAESYAAGFAVKEAAFKALGRGWDECGGFTSVEVVSDSNNRPSVVFHGRAKEIYRRLAVSSEFVSISHDSGMAAAVVVLEN